MESKHNCWVGYNIHSDRFEDEVRSGYNPLKVFEALDQLLNRIKELEARVKELEEGSD